MRTKKRKALPPLNLFGVERTADGQVVIGNLPLVARRGKGSMPDWPCPAPLTPAQAVNMAAYLARAAGWHQEHPGMRPDRDVLKPHAYVAPHDDPAGGPCWHCLYQSDDEIHS